MTYNVLNLLTHSLTRSLISIVTSINGDPVIDADTGISKRNFCHYGIGAILRILKVFMFVFEILFT